jgi:hypothetical protein
MFADENKYRTIFVYSKFIKNQEMSLVATDLFRLEGFQNLRKLLRMTRAQPTSILQYLNILKTECLNDSLF